jgi:hypothetical protein
MPDKKNSTQERNGKNPVKEASKEVPKEASKGTQEVNELRQELVHILADLETEAKEKPGMWVSRIWLTGTLNDTPLFHIVVSMRNNDVVFWVKPPTLRNGYPLVVDDAMIAKIDKLIQALNIVKANIDVVQNKASNRPRKMPRGGIVL